MVVVSQLNGDKIHYEVDEVDNFNDFLKWLMYELEEEDITISYSGYLFHFRTTAERHQFGLGFRVAWEVIDDKYLERSSGRH